MIGATCRRRADRPRAELARRRRDGAAGAGGGAAGVRGAHDRPRRDSGGRAALRGGHGGGARRGRRDRSRAREARAVASGARPTPILLLPNSFGSAWRASRSGHCRALGLRGGRTRLAADARRARGRAGACTRSSTTSSSSRGLGFEAPVGADRRVARIAPRPATLARADALLAAAGVAARHDARRLRAGRGLRPREALAAGSRRAGDRRALARAASCRVLVGAGADRDTGRAIESSLPPGARVVNLIGRTEPAAARRGARAVRRLRVERLGRDAPRRGARRAGDGDLRADRRAGHRAARRRGRDRARRVLPPLHAARLSDRPPLHETH